MSFIFLWRVVVGKRDGIFFFRKKKSCFLGGICFLLFVNIGVVGFVLDFGFKVGCV